MRVNPWVPLGGTLAYNLYCHKRGWPTICSTTRRAVPSKRVAIVALFVSFEALLVHYLDGYPIDLDRLTD